MPEPRAHWIIWGLRTPSGVGVYKTKPGSRRRWQLGPMLAECYHSPTGFEWGYGGSGPAQLAYAILRSHFDAQFTQDFYQEFKFAVVEKLPHKGWTLTTEDILRALSAIVESRNVPGAIDVPQGG